MRIAVHRTKDEECLHNELCSKFREVESDFSDAVEGKSAFPRDGGDVVNKAQLVVNDDPQIASRLCGDNCYKWIMEPGHVV